MPEQGAGKRSARRGALLIGIGALVLWAASRMTWLTVAYADDRTGDGTVSVSGAMWSTETTAVVVVLLAATVAGFALRRGGRRFIGGVSALAAAAAAVAPIGLLLGSPDTERVKALLTYTDEANTAASPAALSEWAEVMSISVAHLGPLLALVGALAALCGSLLLAARPGEDDAQVNKYERAAQRRDNIEADLQAEPESGRVMWDAIDADIDPTDTPRA